MANKPWISIYEAHSKLYAEQNIHTTGHSKNKRLKAGPRLRTLEVRGREGRMGDLPVERLATGALARRLRRAEPLGATSVSSRRTCTDQVTGREASEPRTCGCHSGGGEPGGDAG